MMAAIITTPAEAREYGLSCEGRPTYIPADSDMPPNTARNTVRFTARLNLRANNYAFQSVAGTGIVPTGAVPLLGLDRGGNPVVMHDWRGADGRARYLGLLFDLNDARFQIAGWTINANGQKVAEYFEGSCAVTR
ncbi:hypothetical protein [Sphingobium sp.]|uniref:hypothetical protein n=1 Tax=Sphingobium sp. TaxID=1912891 RepID=UPI002E212838